MAVTQIVKVQRPIRSSEPGDPWLVYAKGRQRVQVIPETKVPRRVKRALGDDLKGYFNADFYADGWAIGGRTADQDW
jgi:hypothetical protein